MYRLPHYVIQPSQASLPKTRWNVLMYMRIFNQGQQLFLHGATRMMVSTNKTTSPHTLRFVWRSMTMRGHFKAAYNSVSLPDRDYSFIHPLCFEYLLVSLPHEQNRLYNLRPCARISCFDIPNPCTMT